MKTLGHYWGLAIKPSGVVAIAYYDATNEDLVYRELVPNSERQIVDDGISPPDLRFVGADASLLFDHGR